MSAVIQNEREFASKLLQLIVLSPDSKSDQFYSTSDYHKLSSLGPTLPKIQIPLPKDKPSEENTSEITSESTIEVSLKSIKPPFKFSTQLSKVPVSHTVYKIKSDLIESLPSLKGTNVKAANLKLLVKGKVIQDTRSLSTLVNDEQALSFMCMVSQPTAESDMTTDPTDDKIDEFILAVGTSDSLVMSENTWLKIYNILVDDLGSEELAKKSLSKMKGSFK